VSASDTAREVALLREEIAAFRAAGGPEAIGLESKTVTQTELVRGLLAHLTKTTGASPAVKIGRNAQGLPTFEVSVPAGVIPGIDTPADALAEATRLYANLAELLPFVKPAAKPTASSDDE
jgi:hypothetical protein